jgi:hypothetical protein
MEHDNEITAEFILRNRRSKRKFDVPPNAQSTLPDAKQIKKSAKLRFAKACDAGVWNRIATLFVEPANPFDQKAPRRLRREAVTLGAMILAFLLLALYFNLIAIAR